MRLIPHRTTLLLFTAFSLNAAHAQEPSIASPDNTSGLRASTVLSFGTSGLGGELLCGGVSAYSVLLGVRTSASAHLAAQLNPSGFGMYATDQRWRIGIVCGSRLSGTFSGFMVIGSIGLETSTSRTSDVTYQATSTGTWPFITFTGTAHSGTTTTVTRSLVVGATLAFDISQTASLSPTFQVSVNASRSVSVELAAGFRFGK